MTYKITTDVLCAGQYVIHVNGNGMAWQMTIPDEIWARIYIYHMKDLINDANIDDVDKETLIKKLNAWRAAIQ